MAKGKKTGGRQKGTPNRATVERNLRAAKGLTAATFDGLLPLDVMMCRMKDAPLPDGSKVGDEQLAAAIAAAPYIHPKLAASVFKGEIAGTDGHGSLQQALALNYDALDYEELMTLRRLLEKASAPETSASMIKASSESGGATEGCRPARRRRD